MTASLPATDPFLATYDGPLSGVLRWEQLDRLWERLRADAAGGWYVYAVGEVPPTAPVSADQLLHFVEELDRLLRADHHEDYCGIVYADDREHPGFIKVFDPHNLGAVCGSSAVPPLPGWILSKLPPVDLQVAFPPPGNRRRWWQRLFGS